MTHLLPRDILTTMIEDIVLSPDITEPLTALLRSGPAPTPDPTSLERSMSALLTLSETVSPHDTAEPFLLLDVDWVITLPAAGAPPRPGIGPFCQLFIDHGVAIKLWSGAGAEHAKKEAHRVGIDKHVTAYLSKPDYPISQTAAISALGSAPILQVDDDATEAVADWPFLHLSPDVTTKEIQ